MREVIYKGRKVTFTVVDAEMPGGKTVRREVVEHPGAAVVLPVFDDETVALERHWRFTVNEWLLEAVAGTIDPGETPEECARRELEEETGLAAEELILIGRFYSSPGVMTELMHAYIAKGVTRGKAKLEEDEALEVVEMRFEEAVRKATSGEIKDAKTIATIMLAKEYLNHE